MPPVLPGYPSGPFFLTNYSGTIDSDGVGHGGDDALDDALDAAAVSLAAARDSGAENSPLRLICFEPARWLLNRSHVVPPGIKVVGVDWSSHLTSSNVNPFVPFFFGAASGVTNADRPSLVGILDGSAAAPTRWGFDTSNGKFLQGVYGDLCHGQYKSRAGGAYFGYFEDTTEFTLDVCLHNPPTAAGAIVGLGDFGLGLDHPYGWGGLYSAGDGTYKWVFCTSANPGEDSWGTKTAVFTPTLTATTRVTLQISFLHQRIAVWVNGVQVSLGGIGPIPGGVTFKAADDAFFGVGTSGFGPGGQMLGFTTAGLKLTQGEVYTVGSTGSSQARADSAAINDNNRYFTYDATTIAYIPFTEARDSEKLTAVNGLGLASDLFIQPAGQGGLPSNGLAELSMAFPGPCAVFGTVLDTSVTRARLYSTMGPAVHAGTGVVVYPFRVLDSILSSPHAAVSTVGGDVRLRGCTFATVGRFGVTNRAGNMYVDETFCTNTSPQTRYVVSCRPGGFGDTFLRVTGMEIDNEGSRIPGFVEAWRQASFKTNAVLEGIVGVEITNDGDPAVLLHDFATSSRAATAKIYGVLSSNGVPYSATGWTVT